MTKITVKTFWVVTLASLFAGGAENAAFAFGARKPSPGSGGGGAPDLGNPVEGEQPRAPERAPLKIMAFSDMNIDTAGTYSPQTRDIVKQMTARRADLILGLGDFIDGEKKNLADSVYTQMWGSFLKWILQPIASAAIPFLPTPGNHDAYYANERSFFQDFWGRRKAEVTYLDDSHYPFFYSFKRNDVFFISLDDAHYESLNNRSVQLKWLEEQLRSSEALTARARIVFGHIPLYSIAANSAKSDVVYDNGSLKQERVSVSSRFSLEGILLDNNVDLVIFGHSHSYFGGRYIYPNGRSLQVLSLPCAGGAQRYLMSTDIKSRYGFVEINLGANNDLSYQYYDARGLAQSTAHLPARLTLDARAKVEYFKGP